MRDPLGLCREFSVNGRGAGRMVSLRRFGRLAGGDVRTLPGTLRIVLESVLRNLGRGGATEEHALRIARWDPGAAGRGEVPFRVARVLLQDISGIPVLMDLDAMRRAVLRHGGDPRLVEPAVPVDLVVDHSIQVDRAGSPDAHRVNARLEMERNGERYGFLKWAEQAFRNLRVLPPGRGIIHQINLEHLARGLCEEDGVWFPDTLLGTDSHTTMANALGIVGWGVGGIEALAAALGEPVSLRLPDVVGVRLDGRLREGATATDLVLTLTERLRRRGVVGAFVEFYGTGARSLPVPDRATVANMAPEFGATMACFPADEATAEYLRATGRSAERVDRWRAYLEEQDLFGIPAAAACRYSGEVVFDLAEVEPVVAGPDRPQQRLPLRDLPAAMRAAGGAARPVPAPAPPGGGVEPLRDGDVLIAAITSCTNTANPALMLAAGLVARKAVERGLRVDPRVKTSLAPGSLAVTAYLERTGLMAPLERLGFHVVGYGCTTCMGGSGPLAAGVEERLDATPAIAVAVLSGNRNFEQRIHPRLRANFLMSPPLVVAYALAGTVAIDLTAEPLGRDGDGRPVHLRDLWPDPREIATLLPVASDPAIYDEVYGSTGGADPRWADLVAPAGPVYAYAPGSTYLRAPPFLDALPPDPPGLAPIRQARALAILGASVTTDHISPVGAIAARSPAGLHLLERGVPPEDFNSYGARRGNHEVMLRGMFANTRLRNRMAGRDGGFTVHQPSGDPVDIVEAAARYRADGVPTLIFAGDEYGTGSSRDWAAKGLRLLGARAVVAEGFERIHRSNLVCMGVLPCELPRGAGLEALALSGAERFDLLVDDGALPWSAVLVVHREGGSATVPLTVRVDTGTEAAYVRHGGILPYLTRRLLASAAPRPAVPCAAPTMDGDAR